MDRVNKELKPWPDEAIVIVAAKHGHATISAMERVITAECMDCHAMLDADSHTFRRAEMDPCRRGRPIWYICVDCFAGYDRSTIDKTIDDRFHKEQNMDTQKQHDRLDNDALREILSAGEPLLPFEIAQLAAETRQLPSPQDRPVWSGHQAAIPERSQR